MSEYATFQKLSIIVPVYNEEWCVVPLYDKIRNVFSGIPQEWEIIYVNDGSEDGTAVRLDELACREHKVKVVHLSRNFGITAAIVAGIDHASGDIFVTMDGNLQNDPADIPKMLVKLDEGYDVCIGWRQPSDKDSFRRELPDRLTTWLISKMTGMHLHDFSCSLRAFRKEVLQNIRIYGEAHKLIPVYANIQGARVAELQVKQYPRAHGHGSEKDRLKKIVKIVLDLILIEYLCRYAMRPMYLFGIFGLFNWAISAATGVMSVFYKITGEKSFIETPLPMISIMTFFAGGMCILMGFLAEVVVRIYYEAQDKPIYTKRRTVNVE